MRKILTKVEERKLAKILGVGMLDLGVPEKGDPPQWYALFAFKLMALAMKNGYGLELKSECAEIQRDCDLDYTIQAFRRDRGPTGVPDEIRGLQFKGARDSLFGGFATTAEPIVREMALALIDLGAHCDPREVHPKEPS